MCLTKFPKERTQFRNYLLDVMSLSHCLSSNISTILSLSLSISWQNFMSKFIHHSCSRYGLVKSRFAQILTLNTCFRNPFNMIPVGSLRLLQIEKTRQSKQVSFILISNPHLSLSVLGTLLLDYWYICCCASYQYWFPILLSYAIMILFDMVMEHELIILNLVYYFM